MQRPSSRFSILPDRSASRASGYTPDRGEKRSSFVRSLFSHSNGSSTSVKSNSVADSLDTLHPTRSRSGSVTSHMSRMPVPSTLGDYDHISEDEDEEDEEGEAIVNDVRTNMKLRQLLGNDAPTSTML
jgi:hypothetical protein